MHLKLLSHAILFALILNWHGIANYWREGPHAVGSFFSEDEISYISIAIGFADQRSTKQRFFYEYDVQRDQEPVAFHIPSHISDYLVGMLANAMHLSPVEVSLLLGVFCTIASYYILSLLFAAISGSLEIGEISAMSMLCLPWLSVFHKYLGWKLSEIPWIVQLPNAEHLRLPVLRSIGTQLSYPILGAALYFGIKATENEKISFNWATFSGIVSGAALYIYFFSWLTALVVIGVFFLLRVRSFQNIKGTLIFLFWHSITIAWGLSLLLYLRKAVHTATSTGFKAAGISAQFTFYLAIENFVLLLILCCCLAFMRQASRARTGIQFIVAILISEILLMNIQSVTHLPISPSHFPVFYLYPLLTGGLVALLFGIVNEQPSFQRISTFLKVTFAAICLFNACNIFYKPASPQDFQQLVNYIVHDMPRQSVLAMKMYSGDQNNTSDGSIRHEPYVIAGVTGRYLLFEDWMSGTSADEAIEREELMGFLLTGTPTLIRKCPKDPYEGIALSDTYNQWLERNLHRMSICRVYFERTDHPSGCELLNKYRVDYVIRENNNPIPELNCSNWKQDKLWSSPEGEFLITQIQRVPS